MNMAVMQLQFMGCLFRGGQVLGALGERAHFIIPTAVMQALLSCLEGCREWKGGRRGLPGAEVRLEISYHNMGHHVGGRTEPEARSHTPEDRRSGAEGTEPSSCQGL